MVTTKPARLRDSPWVYVLFVGNRVKSIFEGMTTGLALTIIAKLVVLLTPFSV
jgi:hypothetical protein